MSCTEKIISAKFQILIAPLFLSQQINAYTDVYGCDKKINNAQMQGHRITHGISNFNYESHEIVGIFFLV